MNNVFADAWSAPGFMKTNSATANGGQVCGSTGASCASGDWRQAYANYLVQYAKDYAAAGVPLSYLGPSNEPDYSANYDSMTMSPAQMASLLDVVGPTVKNSVLSTQVDVARPPAGRCPASTPSAIAADPTALADTAALTSHGYSSAPDLADVRLEQTDLGDRVVDLRGLGPGLGRRLGSVRSYLGAAHQRRADLGQPERVPVLVGQHDALGER